MKKKSKKSGMAMNRQFYQTEIRETFEKKYVKVFLNSLSLIEPLQQLLQTLQSVKRVTITDSTSVNNLSKTLTVYPKLAFSAEEVEDEIHYTLDNYFSDPKINTTHLSNVRQILSEHPKALEVYNSAIEKIIKEEYDRNAIDDMRLAWDNLVSDLTGRNASPNKLAEEIGQLLSKKGVAPQLINMFISMVKQYADYQDKNIKHNTNLSHSDVLFVLNITNAFIMRITQ